MRHDRNVYIWSCVYIFGSSLKATGPHTIRYALFTSRLETDIYILIFVFAMSGFNGCRDWTNTSQRAKMDRINALCYADIMVWSPIIFYDEAQFFIFDSAKKMRLSQPTSHIYTNYIYTLLYIKRITSTTNDLNIDACRPLNSPCRPHGEWILSPIIGR